MALSLVMKIFFISEKSLVTVPRSYLVKGWMFQIPHREDTRPWIRAENPRVTPQLMSISAIS